MVFSDWGLISDCLIFEEENGEKTYMMEQSIGGNDAWNFFYEEAEVGVYSETYNILSKIGEFHWQGIAGECDAVENPTDQKNYVFALRVKTSDDANSLFLLVPEDSYFYEGLAKKTPEQDTSYEVELPKDNTAISSTDFSAVITQNATKDVVIESNENVTFTFAKGTMSAVDGMTSYDFGTKVVADFANAGTMTSSVTKDIFVSRVNFNYSGKLPGTASIKILVGTEYAGKTLYYSKLTENSFTYITSGVVDAQGYVTVSQDSCSDYVLTTEKLTETSSIPNLGNNNMVFVGCAFVVMGIAFVLVGFKNKKMA